jgi:hypothetical protein
MALLDPRMRICHLTQRNQLDRRRYCHSVSIEQGQFGQMFGQAIDRYHVRDDAHTFGCSYRHLPLAGLGDERLYLDKTAARLHHIHGMRQQSIEPDRIEHQIDAVGRPTAHGAHNIASPIK